MGQRRIPPWRRRDAEPGPISSTILISIGVLIVVVVVMMIRRGCESGHD